MVLLDHIMIINLQCSITILAREYITMLSSYRDSKNLHLEIKLKVKQLNICLHRVLRVSTSVLFILEMEPHPN